ncbi:MAG: hypothetical protein KBD15_01850 [Candidatus Magasanikbacteria bacterium]|jgi:hypothetical protein|nr:hypothetical protein [Candidatus Magasanikbacteria bacterium]
MDSIWIMMDGHRIEALMDEAPHGCNRYFTVFPEPHIRRVLVIGEDVVAYFCEGKTVPAKYYPGSLEPKSRTVSIQKAPYIDDETTLLDPPRNG